MGLKNPWVRGRTVALWAVAVLLLGVFVYVGLRSGPLAPVAVTLTRVTAQPLTPALFGIGTVQARYTYKIGPTLAGRLLRLEVHVGDSVKAGQVVGEIDPVDLQDRIHSQELLLKRSQAALQEAQVRHAYAQSQAQRYDKLVAVRAASEEIHAAKQQEWQVAQAALAALAQDVAKARSDREALLTQRRHLRLIAPVDGIVSARDAEPGTTVVAGQSVVEIIDPQSLWIHTRFDQISASGLAVQLAAQVALRSRSGALVPARVLRVEPKADAVTEEILAKMVFDTLPQPLPAVGEMAEVTVQLPPLPAAPLVPNAALHRQGEQVGVWRYSDGSPLQFVPVQLGAADLNGAVQVRQGLQEGERIVVYSEKPLTAQSRVHVVERIAGVAP